MQITAHRTTRVAAVGATLVVAAAGLTACGGDSEGATPETISVGIVALGQLPVDQAVNEGYFEDAGLSGVKIEYKTYPSGASAIPALMAGEVDFVYTNNVSAGLAVSQNLPLRLVTAADSLRAGNQVVLVPSDSDAAGPADLKGATVSVNSLESFGTLGFGVALRDAGLTQDDVTFTEVAFPEAASVMDRGDTGAAYSVQPFAAGAVAAGSATKLFDFHDYKELAGIAVGDFYTSDTYAKDHPEVVEAFDTAVNRALTDMSDDVDLVAALTADAADVDKKTAITIAKTIGWVPNQDLEATQRVFDLMLDFDMVDKPISVDDIALDN